MDTLLQYIYNELEPLINLRVEKLVREALDKHSDKQVEEFMNVEYFLNKYKFSYESFRRRLKQYPVASYYEGKHKVYNVQEFKKACELYKPLKPQFKRFLKTVR